MRKLGQKQIEVKWNENSGVGESPMEEVLLGAWTQGGVPRTSQPLSTYSLSETGVMRSSSFRSCHTYPALYFLVTKIEELWEDYAYMEINRPLSRRIIVMDQEKKQYRSTQPKKEKKLTGQPKKILIISV
jgi:hypothetical protein